jgi:hypothetical protein
MYMKEVKLVSHDFLRVVQISVISEAESQFSSAAPSTGSILHSADLSFSNPEHEVIHTQE